MSDYAHRMTDAELAQLENRIKGIYEEAATELNDTVTAYFADFERRDAEQQRLLDAGKITKDQYTQWRLAQIGRGQRYEALRDKVAERYTKANELAVAYVNDRTPSIYSLNRNYAAYTIEKAHPGADFTLYDESTVRRLAMRAPQLMPNYPAEKALRRGIDLKYGKKQITASITSSILQGKSIRKIADNLQERMETMNRASAIRTARTAFTSAQNGGRVDTYKAATLMGIDLQQEWLATLDGRTRHSHRALDGERINVGETFSNGCRFPGDPEGAPAETYNCRCTLVAVVDGVDTSDAKRRARNEDTGQNEVIPNMTYSQWADRNEKKSFTGWINQKLIRENSNDSSVPAALEYICSETYRAAFAGIHSTKVDGEVCRQSRRAIKLNNGGVNENYAFVFTNGDNTVTGKTGAHGGSINADCLEGRGLNSVILTHNHPNSGTFSTKDIQVLLNCPQIKMIVAAGHDGTVYKLSAKTSSRNIADNINIEYNILKRDLGDENEVMIALANRYGWKYEKCEAK